MHLSAVNDSATKTVYIRLQANFTVNKIQQKFVTYLVVYAEFKIK